MTTIKAHFDGKAFIPDEPVTFSRNQAVTLHVEPSVLAAPTLVPEAGKGTFADLLNSGLVGIWKDRTDIGDSLEFARTLRKQAETRHHEINHPQ